MKCLIDAEDWLPIQDYEGFYEISSHGRVRSVDRVHTMTGRHPKAYGRRLKGKIKSSNGKPYLAMVLYRDGVGERLLVHRVVAHHFCVRNYELHQEVNHIDEDKTNNFASNLEWCTRSENALHSCYKTTGSLNGGSKLDEEDVLEIKELLKTDWSLRAIAERFEVSYHAIHKIKCGKNWSWLTGLDKEVSI